ncbi:MAG: alkaline phosphatase family protein [Gemmatimonadetes bacterium]|nr:alkaline phosphatase family protein [Gemmatimonadota bacterium]MDA1102172.1 alkaline phosphatase family protein [Gemmatimonadota bacterium]
MAAAPKVLLVFLDGVGIGTSDHDTNPFLRARIPTLTDLMGGLVPTLERPATAGPRGRAFPLTATLDVEGTPQSGTGQVALLTGESAAEIYGRHFGPWTPVRLRPLVEQRSVLRLAVEAKLEVAFANAYPRGWPGDRGGRRIAGPPLAARGAGLLTRHEEALGTGDAISSEIVNDGWRDHLGHSRLPVIAPEEAGANLAKLAERHDLTLFAHYATDTAGHRGRMDGAIAALEMVDAFLDGLVAQLASDVLLLIASDHGNIEDVTSGHTRNPALGIASGPRADAASELSDLRQVCPFILDLLHV